MKTERRNRLNYIEEPPDVGDRKEGRGGKGQDRMVNKPNVTRRETIKGERRYINTHITLKTLVLSQAVPTSHAGHPCFSKAQISPNFLPFLGSGATVVEPSAAPMSIVSSGKLSSLSLLCSSLLFRLLSSPEKELMKFRPIFTFFFWGGEEGSASQRKKI